MVSLIKMYSLVYDYCEKTPKLGQISFAQKFGGNYHCVGLKGFSLHPFGSIIVATNIYFLPIYWLMDLMGPIKFSPHFVIRFDGSVATNLTMLVLVYFILF
jgi:hypothetical protein